MMGQALRARPEERVVDLDAGAGLVALHAARSGASVVCVDREPASLLCIRRSFLLAGLGDPELISGESLAAVGDGLVDVIAWTAPFLEGDRGQSRVMGRRGDAEATFQAAHDRLARGGRFLVAWPDRDAQGWLGSALTAVAFRWSRIRRASFPVIGGVTVYRCWRAEGGGSAGEVSGGDTLPGAAWVMQGR
jgi:methylase of polypeptide subunit release factors